MLSLITSVVVKWFVKISSVSASRSSLAAAAAAAGAVFTCRTDMQSPGSGAQAASNKDGRYAALQLSIDTHSFKRDMLSQPTHLPLPASLLLISLCVYSYPALTCSINISSCGRGGDGVLHTATCYWSLGAES